MYAFSRFMRYFVEVAEQGSIRKASETLSVSASAINRQILLVEEELGTLLFERLPSGLRVTAAGELLLGSSQRWAKEFERLNSQIADLEGLRRGRVRFATIDALSKGFVPKIARDLKEEYADIAIDLTVFDNEGIQPAIQKGEVDFGLMIGPSTSKDLLIRAHRDIRLGFVTRPDHPLQRVGGVRFNRCVGYPVVAPAPPLALFEQIEFLQVVTGVVLEPAVTSNNIQMLKSLVGEGLGVGILTSLDIMEEVRLGELAFTPILEKPLRPMPLALCVAPSRQLSRAARLVLQRVEQALLDADLGAASR